MVDEPSRKVSSVPLAVKPGKDQLVSAGWVEKVHDVDFTEFEVSLPLGTLGR
jgi:hypothetical protein